MRIKQYQGGGIYYTPYFRDGQQSGNQTVASSSSSSEDKEEQLIQKEIVSVLKENGLPNDVDFFLGKANSFLSKAKGIGFLIGGDSSYDMSDLIQLQSLANRVRHNNALYTEATERVKTESSGSEVAITNDGKLYALTKKGLTTITSDTYHKNPKNYQLISNTDLVHLRAEDPNLSYNGSILSDLANSVGMKSIVDYVKSTIGAFGTNKADQSFDRYTAKHQGRMENGFEQLLGLGPDGVYKVGEKSSRSDQGYSSQEDLDLAVNYLYKTLPANMRNVLKANAAAEGLDPNDPESAKRLLQLAIYKHTDHSYSQDATLNYEGDASKAAGVGATKEASVPQVPDTFGHMVLLNKGSFDDSAMTLGGNVQFHMPRYHYDIIQNQSGNQIGSVTTGEETYNNLQANGIVDTAGKVYFGEVPLDNIAYSGQDIIVDNTKGGDVIYLPTKNGELDTTVMQQMTAIQNDINNRHVSDEASRRQIWEENGFQYNPSTKTGIPTGYDMKPYWAQNAYTTTKADAMARKDLRLATMLDKVGNDVVERLGNTYNINPGNSNKGKIDITGWLSNSYKGKLFIPVSGNEQMSLMAGGIGYIDRQNNAIVKAQQDAVRVGGGYNYATRQYDASLVGTDASDLD